MGYHRTYGLSGLGWGGHSPNVAYENGKPVDLTCPGREPVEGAGGGYRYTAGGVPVWGMTSSSGWAAKPITDPGQIPCGAKQANVVSRLPLKKIATSAAIAAGGVALTSLGAGVVQAGSGVLTQAGGAAGASQSSGMFAAIKAKGNTILDYVNQGRTIKAIADGEIPPPPVSITGNSFLEWGFQVAKDELMKEQQRKLTRAEEEALKREIQLIQSQLEQRAGNVPKSPSPAVPEPVQRRQQQIVIEQEKKKGDLLPVMLAVGLPALLIIAMKG